MCVTRVPAAPRGTWTALPVKAYRRGMSEPLDGADAATARRAAARVQTTARMEADRAAAEAEAAASSNPQLRKALLVYAAACARAAAFPEDKKARRDAARAAATAARGRSDAIRAAAGLPIRGRHPRGKARAPQPPPISAPPLPARPVGPIALEPPRPLKVDGKGVDDRELFGRGARRPIARRY